MANQVLPNHLHTLQGTLPSILAALALLSLFRSLLAAQSFLILPDWFLRASYLSFCDTYLRTFCTSPVTWTTLSNQLLPCRIASQTCFFTLALTSDPFLTLWVRFPSKLPVHQTIALIIIIHDFFLRVFLLSTWLFLWVGSQFLEAVFDPLCN